MGTQGTQRVTPALGVTHGHPVPARGALWLRLRTTLLLISCSLIILLLLLVSDRKSVTSQVMGHSKGDRGMPGHGTLSCPR